MVCIARIKEQIYINLFTPFLASCTLSIFPSWDFKYRSKRGVQWVSTNVFTVHFFPQSFFFYSGTLLSPSLYENKHLLLYLLLASHPNAWIGSHSTWLAINVAHKLLLPIFPSAGPSIRMTTWIRKTSFFLDRKSISNRKYLPSGDERYRVRLLWKGQVNITSSCLFA